MIMEFLKTVILNTDSVVLFGQLGNEFVLFYRKYILVTDLPY